ncbi:MAG: hypothetical protein JNL38_33415 [Myxococcales bacterium]|jgi:hypothetical protein|nr:hypothetical protein [Myxococcales bacterium]
MALLQLSSDYPEGVDSVRVTPAAAVRVGVHDASRVEWSVSVPLPEGKPLKYTIRVELRIPNNTFVQHAPWGQLQSFTRLDGPAMSAVRDDEVSIDALRRGAVAFATRLGRASDGFGRHCRLAASLFSATPDLDLAETLLVWLTAAERMVAEARERVARPRDGDADEVRRERELVDEYVSVRLLELLAGAERALLGATESRSAHKEAICAASAVVEARVADMLEREIRHREARGYIKADPTSPSDLEGYLDRASRLKKHFQEVLFLEAETVQLADRVHHWVAAFVAVVASTWAFAWQIALMNQQPTAGTRLGSGIVALAIIAGVVYAAKDRIKEAGRQWLSGKVLHRVYGAQRLARFRAPARRLPGRDVIVTARELFDQTLEEEADPLNPVIGATMPVTVIRYEHRGEVSPQPKLSAAGVRRIKHVFRYDLSPLFARLDDAVKPIPVLDEAKKVRFIDAPRCYRLPIEVEVETEGATSKEIATLVLHKRGLDRIEKDEASDPRLAEHDLDPDPP